VTYLYGLDNDKGSIPEKVRNPSLLHTVQIGSGAQPTSYPVGTNDFIPAGKAAGASSQLLSSI
jgi:hypothetical protein